MKQIDRLISKEIVGPWFFGIGMFTALIFAATYLNRLVEYIVQGASVGVVIQLFLLMLPAVVVKTFSMALLLAGLLGFGRLSSDSEIVSLRAAGASIYRIIVPVAGFSIAVATLTWLFNEQVVPLATKQSLKLADEIVAKAKETTHASIAQKFDQDNKLRLGLVAASYSLNTQTMHNVVLTAFDEQERPSFVMEAREVELESLSPPRWRVKSGGRLIPWNSPGLVIKFDEAWPKSIPQIPKTLSEILRSKPDQDSMTMVELREMIAKHEERRDVKLEELNDYRYWYWNKFATPLAAVCFGCLGAVLGIRNHRTGTAGGFALAIAIIFGYVMLTNFMNVWAKGGALPPWLASFTPLGIGLAASFILMKLRNR